MKTLVLDTRTSFGFFALGEDQSTRILKTLGFSQVYQINACGFNRNSRFFLGFHPRQQRVILVQCCFSGDDQLLNQQAHIYYLRPPQSGQPTSVLIYREPKESVSNGF